MATRGRTVPQIYIGTRLVGTYDNLVMLERSGELSQLLDGQYQGEGQGNE